MLSYQIMTNDEMYQSFKENCSTQVRLIMEEHSKERIATAMKRPESQDRNLYQESFRALPGGWSSNHRRSR